MIPRDFTTIYASFVRAAVHGLVYGGAGGSTTPFADYGDDVDHPERALIAIGALAKLNAGLAQTIHEAFFKYLVDARVLALKDPVDRRLQGRALKPRDKSSNRPVGRPRQWTAETRIALISIIDDMKQKDRDFEGSLLRTDSKAVEHFLRELAKMQGVHLSAFMSEKKKYQNQLSKARIESRKSTKKSP